MRRLIFAVLLWCGSGLLGCNGQAAAEKQFALFGAVNGHRGDYGHDDLVIGRHARSEVFPLIRRWLDQRSGKPLLRLKLLPPAKK